MSLALKEDRTELERHTRAKQKLAQTQVSSCVAEDDREDTDEKCEK